MFILKRYNLLLHFSPEYVHWENLSVNIRRKNLIFIGFVLVKIWDKQ